MLNLHQVARKTNRFRQEGARYVKFTDIKKGYNSDGLGFIAGASYSTHTINQEGKAVRNDQPHKYVTVLTFLDNALNCNISCSCADFTYRWEVALHNKGAADIEYSNGQAPILTNPTLKPAMCKHSLSLYLKIKDKLPAPRPNLANKKGKKK